MKKILTIVIAALTVVMCFALVSCGHECEFKSEWSKDATHHWHDCTDEKCELVSDKAEHTWNEGVVTTPATESAEGVKTFTCTVCGQTKTEPVAFTGLTETEWNAAFGIGNFSNFYMNEVANTIMPGMSMEVVTEYKFTANKAYMKMTMLGESQEETVTDQITVDAYREQILTLFDGLVTYADYDYDAETKTYKANKAINIPDLDETDNVTLKFDDTGRIIEITYSINDVDMGGIIADVEYTMTVEYGNVEL